MSKFTTAQNLTDFFVNKILPVQIQTQTSHLVETLSVGQEQHDSLGDFKKLTNTPTTDSKSLLLGKKGLQAVMTDISKKRQMLTK